jgi:hypothetical protein
MRNLTFLEKILSIVTVILLSVVVYFGYHLQTFDFFSIKYNAPPSDFKPPTLKESIKSSKVIFTCATEDEGKNMRFRIDRILYKIDDFEFPYNIGEIYGDLSEKKRPNMYYCDGRLLFICDGPISLRSFSIRNDEIRPYDGVNSNKVISIKEISELIKVYKNL